LKRSSKWVHIISLYCLLSPWRPPGQYGVSSRPMAASSGFRSSPGHAALDDAACIASTLHMVIKMACDGGAFVRRRRLFRLA
jgi:hypothetical protein